MFDVSEEHWESLEEYDRMLAICEEKICNFISDPDKYLEVISKGNWDIDNCNLVEHEIHLKHDRSIKSPVQYINPRLAD